MQTNIRQGGGPLNKLKTFLFKNAVGTNVILLIVLAIFTIAITGLTSYAIFSDSAEGKSTINLTVGKRTLNNSILERNEKNVVTSGDGLYKTSDTYLDAPTYYYRGNVTNNWVLFADRLWRIVRINENRTVRIVTQNGIAENGSYPYLTPDKTSAQTLCINERKNTCSQQLNKTCTDAELANYHYACLLRSFYWSVNTYISDNNVNAILNTWFDNNIGNVEKYVNKVADKWGTNRFCGQAKARAASGNLDSDYGKGIKIETLITDYTPSLQCEATIPSNVYTGVFPSNVGLLSVDEVLLAGYNNQPSQANKDVYLANGETYTNSNGNIATTCFWTITPSGGQNKWNQYGVFVFCSNGVLSYNWTFSKQSLRPVINLKADLPVTGKGTEDDPYVIVDEP